MGFRVYLGGEASPLSVVPLFSVQASVWGLVRSYSIPFFGGSTSCRVLNAVGPTSVGWGFEYRPVISKVFHGEAVRAYRSKACSFEGYSRPREPGTELTPFLLSVLFVFVHGVASVLVGPFMVLYTYFTPGSTSVASVLSSSPYPRIMGTGLTWGTTVLFAGRACLSVVRLSTRYGKKPGGPGLEHAQSCIETAIVYYGVRLSYDCQPTDPQSSVRERRGCGFFAQGSS